MGQNAASNPIPQLHTSNPAHVSQSIGGVGRNVALAAHLVSPSTNVKLCSMIGDDMYVPKPSPDTYHTIVADPEQCRLDRPGIAAV